jgi:hypothetical protein
MRNRLTVTMIAVLLGFGPAAAQRVGSGALAADNDQDRCPGADGFVYHDPSTGQTLHWDIQGGRTVHLSIQAALRVCTSGPFIGRRCESDADCSTAETAGSCSAAPQLECSSADVLVVRGHRNVACSTDADCYPDRCDLAAGFCKFQDAVPASGTLTDIHACYTARPDACATATVTYCGKALAHANNPPGSQIYVPADLRVVDSAGLPVDCGADNGSVPLTVAENAPAPATASAQISRLSASACGNAPGSLCCTLTQGAYGAPNSVATAPCPFQPSEAGCVPGSSGCGLIAGAQACGGLDAFAGGTLPNATTIGRPGNSVTLKNLQTLVDYLPAGGPPGTLRVNEDVLFDSIAGPPIPDRIGAGSGGQGGGVLSGQAMTLGLNLFFSQHGYTPAGLENVTAPSLGASICTRRSGPDKVLGTDDDVCQAFAYPACVAGRSAADIRACANEQLRSGANSCGCTAAELVSALSNLNQQFDECAEVIECTGGVASGAFPCEDGATPL